MNSVSVVLLSANLVMAAATAHAQTTSASIQPASVTGHSNLLPSLKTHMARLGSLMNKLFRDIDEAEKSTELLQATQEMEALLVMSRDYKPDIALFEPDPGKEAAILQKYQACMDDARRLLADLRAALANETDEQPRQKLLKLDQVRRNCHAAFG